MLENCNWKRSEDTWVTTLKDSKTWLTTYGTPKQVVVI